MTRGSGPGLAVCNARFWRSDDSEDDGRMTPKCGKPEDDSQDDCRMTAAWGQDD